MAKPVCGWQCWYVIGSADLRMTMVFGIMDDRFYPQFGFAISSKMSIAAEKSSYPTFPSLTNRATRPVRSRVIVLLSAELRNPKIYEFNPDVLYDPKRPKNSKAKPSEEKETIPPTGNPPPGKKTSPSCRTISDEHKLIFSSDQNRLPRPSYAPTSAPQRPKRLFIRLNLRLQQPRTTNYQPATTKTPVVLVLNSNPRANQNRLSAAPCPNPSIGRHSGVFLQASQRQNNYVA